MIRAGMGFFFLFVAAFASYGLFRVVKSNERDRKYLEAGKDEAPLVLDHLSLTLQRVARETRMLRISLEAPIRDVAEFRRGQLNATAEDLESFDGMLMNVSRDVAEWLGVVDKLEERDRSALRDYGVSVEPVRQALASEGFAFERRHLQRDRALPLDDRLRAISRELSKIEAALQGSPRVYR